MRLTCVLRRFSQAFSAVPETSERYLQYDCVVFVVNIKSKLWDEYSALPIYVCETFCNSEMKSGKVAIIGPPNSGKSLLTNKLAKADVSAVSSKMDTTQQNTLVSLTMRGCQLVMIDTPGTVGIQHAREVIGKKAGRELTDPENAFKFADHILVVHDSTATGDYIHHRVLHLLHRSPHLRSTLVMNKVDLVKRRSDLLELVRILCNGRVGGQRVVAVRTQIGRLGKVSEKGLSLHLDDVSEKDEKWQELYRRLMLKPTSRCGYAETKKLFQQIRGWSNFESVFYTSALTGEGVEDLRDHLLNIGEKKPYRYDPGMITTKRPQLICRDAIRAQLLDELPGSIAYELKVHIDEWQMDGEVLQVVAVIECPEEKWGKYVIGGTGKKIARMSKAVNEAMQNLFKQQLFIRILVKSNGKLLEVPKPKLPIFTEATPAPYISESTFEES